MARDKIWYATTSIFDEGGNLYISFEKLIRELTQFLTASKSSRSLQLCSRHVGLFHSSIKGCDNMQRDKCL